MSLYRESEHLDKGIPTFAQNNFFEYRNRRVAGFVYDMAYIRPHTVRREIEQLIKSEENAQVSGTVFGEVCTFLIPTEIDYARELSSEDLPGYLSTKLHFLDQASTVTIQDMSTSKIMELNWKLNKDEAERIARGQMMQPTEIFVWRKFMPYLARRLQPAEDIKRGKNPKRVLKTVAKLLRESPGPVTIVEIKPKEIVHIPPK